MPKNNDKPLSDEDFFSAMFAGATGALQKLTEDQVEQEAKTAARQLGLLRRELVKQGFSASEAFEIVRMTLQQGHEQNLADA